MALTNAAQPQSVPFHTPPLPPSELTSQSSSHSPLPPADWNTVFSSPLDPSTFAALIASGVLGPATPSVPSSLPASRAMRSPGEFPQNQRVHDYTKDLNRSSPTQPVSNANAWTGVSGSYANSALSQRISSSHSRSNSNNVTYMKRRSPIPGGLRN